MLSHIIELKEQLQYPNSPAAEIEILHELAWTYFLREESDELEAALGKAWELLEDERAAVFHAQQDMLLAYTKILTVGYADALEHALNTQQHWHSALLGAWKWRMQYLLAIIYSRIGNFDEAMSAYRNTYEIALRDGDGFGEQLGVSGVGFVYGYLRDYPNAERYFLQSLEIANRVAHAGLQITAYYNLCQLYSIQEELDKAEDAAQQTVIIAESLQDDKSLALATTRLALILIERGQYAEATQLLENRLEHLPDTKSLRSSRMNLLGSLARVYNLQGHYQLAIDILTNRIEAAKVLGNSLMVLSSYEELVTAYEQLGNYQEALRCQKEHFALYKKFHDERNVEKIQVLEILHRTRETEAQLAHQKQLAQDAIAREEQSKQYFEELSNIKNEFIDSATHDLKNPLTGIRLNTELLRRRIAPSYHRYLDRIDTDTERMNRLIADMLDTAKLETGNALNLSFDSMQRLIDEVLSTHIVAASTRRISIGTNYPDYPVRFYFDAMYLYRCLSNLISNAIKYSNEGTQVKVMLNASDDFVSIVVADKGVGIPEADLPHIFERFYRVEDEAGSKIEGTGLGLSIVKSIVEQHKGNISVASQVGKGTTFTITLPYIKDLATISNAS